MTTPIAANGRKTKAEKKFAETVARAEALKALGDPARLEIVELLRTGPAESVMDILTAINGRLSQPTVSHHLRVLMTAGVIERRKHGVFAAYALIPQRLDEIASWIAPAPSA